MLVVKGMLMGLFIGFVLWCIREAVVEYRHHRKMKKKTIAAMRALRMSGPIWAWRREGYVWPLFHEQRRK